MERIDTLVVDKDGHPHRVQAEGRGGRAHRRLLGIRGAAAGCERRTLALIGIHLAAALAHIFVYRDRVMQRMFSGRDGAAREESRPNGEFEAELSRFSRAGDDEAGPVRRLDLDCGPARSVPV